MVVLKNLGNSEEVVEVLAMPSGYIKAEDEEAEDDSSISNEYEDGYEDDF